MAAAPQLDPFDFPSVPSSGARAAVVNRTHRVVRERATAMQVRRNRMRSLILPLSICSVLLLLFCYAGWSASGTGMTLGLDGEGGPAYVLLLWFLPVTAFAVGAVLFRKWRSSSRDEVNR